MLMSKYTGNVSERVMCKCSFDYTPALWGYASSGAIRVFLGSINRRISQHVLYSQGDENSRYLHLSPSLCISSEACRHAVTRFYCISLCGLFKILWQRIFSYPINFFRVCAIWLWCWHLSTAGLVDAFCMSLEDCITMGTQLQIRAQVCRYAVKNITGLSLHSLLQR